MVKGKELEGLRDGIGRYDWVDEFGGWFRCFIFVMIAS